MADKRDTGATRLERARKRTTAELDRQDKVRPKKGNRHQRKAKEERIRRIIGLMTTPGGWRTGVTAKKLAAEYGLKLGTIRRDAIAAGRYIRGDLMDREEMRASILSQYQAIVAQSFKGGKYRDSISSLDSISEILGIKRRHVEVELEIELDKKLTQLAEVLQPEIYHIVTSVLAGKSVQAAPGDSDRDDREQSPSDGSGEGPEGSTT